MSIERIAVFIDGFNLYHGLKSKYPNLKWLDLHKLSLSLLKPNQTLVSVNFFTAMVLSGGGKAIRQNAYLSALKTTPVKIILGRYSKKSKRCRACGATWVTYEEKMTDVNISVAMILGAVNDEFDKAIVISGDTDLHKPITKTKALGKEVIIVFPPNRHTNRLKQIADASFVLGRGKLKSAQFPNTINSSGFPIQKPTSW